MSAAESAPRLGPMLMNRISVKFEEKFIPMFKPGDEGWEPPSKSGKNDRIRREED
jgi:hypothetical protein